MKSRHGSAIESTTVSRRVAGERGDQRDAFVRRRKALHRRQGATFCSSAGLRLAFRPALAMPFRNTSSTIWSNKPGSARRTVSAASLTRRQVRATCEIGAGCVSSLAKVA
jgi:hypothetical protein